MLVTFDQSVEKFGNFFGCFTADSQTDAGRHQLYNNGSLVLFPLLGSWLSWRARIATLEPEVTPHDFGSPSVNISNHSFVLSLTMSALVLVTLEKNVMHFSFNSP